MRYPTIVFLEPSYLESAKEFLDHLLTLGYSASHAHNRTRQVKQFLQAMEVQGITELAGIGLSHILRYYEYLRQRPNRNSTGATLRLSSVHDHMYSLDLFFTVLQSKGLLEIHPMGALHLAFKKEQIAERAVLTQEEVQLLYSHCETLQERVILALGYGCGLRVSELVACNIEDISLREGILIVPRGKGNKRRVVPLSKGVVSDLSQYFYRIRMYQESEDQKAFMLHSMGNRMQEDTYNKHLKNIIQRTKSSSILAKRITMHNLRHSIATHLIEQQMPLEQVRMFLGHSQIETTEVYTHISGKQLKEIIYGNTENLSGKTLQQDSYRRL